MKKYMYAFITLCMIATAAQAFNSYRECKAYYAEHGSLGSDYECEQLKMAQQNPMYASLNTN